MAKAREFYIEPGATKIAPPNVPVEFYLYEINGHPCAQAFVGRAQKPTWHYRFKTSERRQECVDAQIEAVKLKEAAKAKRREERKNHTLQVGDVLVSSWGYDQTNVDFYKVTRRVGSSTIEYVTLPKLEVKESAECHGMACRVIPAIDHNTISQTKYRARVSNDSIKIHSCSYARKWNGKPEYCSWYA